MECFNLGNMYALGKGVTRDQFTAVDFYQKACEGGRPSGCWNAASAYHTGNGRPYDEGEALKYVRKACELKDLESCEVYKQIKKGK